jgi:hypothetical protein
MQGVGLFLEKFSVLEDPRVAGLLYRFSPLFGSGVDDVVD